MINNAVIYVRVSSEDLDKNISRSIENQILGLQNFATNNSFTLCDIYIDDGYSGKDLNRPAMNKLLEDMKQNKFNIILIKDVSRLGRNMGQVNNLIEEVFPENNIRLISTNENYDSNINTSDDAIILNSFFNDFYLRECSKKSRDTMQRRSLTTNMSNRGCYGYILDKDKNIVIDENPAKIVQVIFDMYVNGINTSEITKHINSLNVPTPAYQKMLNYNQKCYNITPIKYFKWSTMSIVNILKKYDYTGNAVNLKQLTTHNKTIYRNSNPKIIENTHPKIISKEVFNQAKNILEKNIIPKQTNPYRLIKYFICKGCNRYLTYNGKDKYLNPLYKCKKCGKIYNGTKLHKAIECDAKNIIKEYLKSPDTFKDKCLSTIRTNNNFNDYNKLIKIKSDITNKISNQLNEFVNEKITKEQYTQEVQTCNSHLIDLEKQLVKFNNTIITEKLFSSKYKEFISNLKAIPDKLDQLDLIRLLTLNTIVSRVDKKLELEINYKYH